MAKERWPETDVLPLSHVDQPCSLLYSKMPTCIYYVLFTVVSEPNEFRNYVGQCELSPEQLAEDFVIFHRVLTSYPCFNKSRVVGPDVTPRASDKEGLKMIQA